MLTDQQVYTYVLILDLSIIFIALFFFPTTSFNRLYLSVFELSVKPQIVPDVLLKTEGVSAEAQVLLIRTPCSEKEKSSESAQNNSLA